MKVSVEIDTTPQELRVFFGLPDIEPLQQEMLEVLRKNTLAKMEEYDSTTMLNAFLPENVQSLNAFQQTIWQAMLGQMFKHPQKYHNTSDDSEQDKKK